MDSSPTYTLPTYVPFSAGDLSLSLRGIRWGTALVFSAGPASKKGEIMRKVQAVAAVLLGLGAAIFAFSALPQTFESVTFSNFSSGVTEAQANYELNSANTDNVYQQIVVAGWGTKDMTEAVAQEAASIKSGVQFLLQEQQRSSAMLIILVGLMAVMVILQATTAFFENRPSTNSAEAAPTEGPLT